MAHSGGDFDFYDPELDHAIDNDVYDDDDDQEEENTTQPFQPTASSTPYHGGEQHEMQTMQHEQSGLPTYDERTPLLGSSDPRTDEIERRLAALREDGITGLIDIREVDPSVNLLSEEDKRIRIERVKQLIRKKYPSDYCSLCSLLLFSLDRRVERLK